MPTPGYSTMRASSINRWPFIAALLTLVIVANINPPRAAGATNAGSSSARAPAAASAHGDAAGQRRCFFSKSPCGTPMLMPVGTAEIWFTNLTSCTPNAIAEALLDQLDGIHGPVAHMIQTGDDVIMTDRYLAWIDNTWSPDDPVAGGLLRGLWNVAFPRGPCHGVSIPDVARDALLPSTMSRGAGYSLILNTDPDCVDGGSVGGRRIPEEFSAEWERHPRVAWRRVANGIQYTTTGHFTNPDGSTNLDPGGGAVASMAYLVTYGFEESSPAIAIRTRIWRDGSARPVTVSQLFAADFDTERYPFQAEQYSIATVRRRFSLRPFPQIAAGQVADDPPRGNLVYTTWTAGPPALRPGSSWTMYSNPPLRRSLSIRITAESDEFAQRYSLAQHASWNQTNSDSLTFMAIQSAPQCGRSPRLSGRYFMNLALELTASSGPT